MSWDDEFDEEYDDALEQGSIPGKILPLSNEHIQSA